MQGLMFVLWEHFLTDFFGELFTTRYRQSINQEPSTAPKLSRSYTDDTLFQAVKAAARLAHVDEQFMYYEYGRYFIKNPLVHRLYHSAVSHAKNSRDMLRVLSSALTPIPQTNEEIALPSFTCISTKGQANSLTISTINKQQLCGLLQGAIIGIGEIYKKRVRVKEHSCTRKGDAICQFEAIFESSQPQLPPPASQQRQQQIQLQQIEERILLTLPYTQQSAISHLELQKTLTIRPVTLLQALNHLQSSGLIATQPAYEIMFRRYWRALSPSIKLLL